MFKGESNPFQKSLQIRRGNYLALTELLIALCVVKAINEIKISVYPLTECSQGESKPFELRVSAM